MISSIIISYHLKIILFEVVLITNKDYIFCTYVSPHVDLHIIPTLVSYCSYKMEIID